MPAFKIANNYYPLVLVQKYLQNILATNTLKTILYLRLLGSIAADPSRDLTAERWLLLVPIPIP